MFLKKSPLRGAKKLKIKLKKICAASRRQKAKNKAKKSSPLRGDKKASKTLKKLVKKLKFRRFAATKKLKIKLKKIGAASRRQKAKNKAKKSSPLRGDKKTSKTL